VWINTNRGVGPPLRGKYDRLGCRPGLAATPSFRVPGGRRQRFPGGALYYNAGRSRTFWIHGKVYGKYRDRGESGGALSMPRSDVERLRVRGCKSVLCSRALFERGAIYLKGGLGAHELHGRVFRFFWSHRRTDRFGFPQTDVRKRPSGAKWARFERGTIVCPATDPCRRR
jgi:uncharacterized protein with LGFP repeats